MTSFLDEDSLLFFFLFFLINLMLFYHCKTPMIACSGR